MNRKVSLNFYSIVSASLILVLGVVVVFLYSSAYVVEEGKQVIVTQFGRPVGEVKRAGLHFRKPLIQEIHYLESRQLPWDGAPESMQTRDKKRIDIDVWARWQIIDPQTFFVKVRTEQRGQKILDDLVDSAVRDVVARHNLIDVVRKSNAPLIYESEELQRSAGDQVMGRGRDGVEEEILEGVVLQELGI
jgi:membrane protease subunit HflC